MHTHQFVLSSVDLLKTPGNQWQRQLGCNTYNEQSSNEHAESLRWSESGISHTPIYVHDSLVLML